MKIGSDNIGSLFLGTEEIGKAYLGSELVHSKELPYDAKVEYIQSTGTQYIDTGILPSLDFECEAKAEYTSNQLGYDTLLGAVVDGTNFGVAIALRKDGNAGGDTNSGYIQFGVQNENPGRTLAISSIATLGLHTYHARLHNSVISMTVDGVTDSQQHNGTTPSQLSMYMFARHRQDTGIGNYSNAKLYYCKIWNGGNLVFDAYPVRVGQVGYLYDTISGQLFGNDGTGAFTLGADVANEMSLRMSKSFIADNPTILYGGNERWTYRGGLLLRGMLGVYDDYSNDKDVSDLLAYAKKYYHDCVNSGGIVGGAWGSYAKSDYDSDQVQAGYNLFRLKQLDSDTTYQGYYENVIGILIDQLADQPRLVEPTSVQGTKGHPYQHKANYAYQHWLDGDFMVEPFRALYAHDRLSGQSQADMYDDIVEQLINTAALTYDTDTQLYRHAFAGQGSSASWSENGANTIGRSYFAWGRALGWYILAINEVLDIIPSSHNATRRSVLTGILSNLLTRLLAYRDTSGVWALLPTLAVDATNNKLEATSSCMYAYGYLHGVRMGYLSADMRDTALSVYQAVVRNFVTVNGASVTLKNCVTGGNPGASSTTQTDVLNNYYSKPFADNDEHGVGPFIMASLEYELITTT